MFEHHLTSENGYITAVKSALLRQGFWGQPVRKLLEELRDHFHTKTGTLEAEGRLFSVQPVIRCMPVMEADVTISLWTVVGNVLI